MSETPFSEEFPKNPEQEIRSMGRGILNAIDEIIEEHGWLWSKQPRMDIPFAPLDASAEEVGRNSLQRNTLSLGRRFDPENHKPNFNEEAFCMAQVLEKGIIPQVKTPGELFLPHGIFINFRSAPEFILQWSNQERLAKATGVMEELLRKLDFLDTLERLTDPSDRKTVHMLKRKYDPTTATWEVSYETNPPNIIYDYSWISNSSEQGGSFTEIKHPKLPFVVDVMMPQQSEDSPVAYVRYIPGTGELSEEEAVREAESLLKGERDQGAAVEEAENILNEKSLVSELEEALAEGLAGYPATLEYAKQAARQILGKQKTLVELMISHPKQRVEAWSGQEKFKFRAELGKGTKFFQQEDGLFYLEVSDQIPPQKFDCKFLKFSTPQEGAKHPAAMGVETDNLMVIKQRDDIDQTWRTGTYFINQEGLLVKFEADPGLIRTPKGIRNEHNLVISVLNTMINKFSSV